MTPDPVPLEDAVDDETWSTLARLGRALRVNEADLQQTLDAVTATAVEVIAPAEYASVNLMIRGRFSPQSVHGAAPHELDELQKRVGVGPCIEASNSQVTVRIADCRTDDRWPEYVRLATQLGVLSMLCVPLWVEELRVGSLSLYATAPDGFDERDARLADLFALHAALALADAQRTANLRRAASNRDVIGQAKGILMERHKITADQAFDLLSTASQRLNRRLADVAEEFVRTGALS